MPSISTLSFYQLKYAKTYVQLGDIKQSTLKGVHRSQIFNLVLNGSSTPTWHSVNAIKNRFVSQGEKIFSIPVFLQRKRRFLSNRKKKTPSTPQTYIIKAQTKINIHEKISENFKNIPLRVLKKSENLPGPEMHILFLLPTSEVVFHNTLVRPRFDISTKD